MIAREIAEKDGIVVTRTDFARLQDLLESWRARPSVSVAALTQELRHGKLVADKEVSDGIVTMNSRVHVRHLDERVSKTYTVVYPKDANVDQGKISVLAPIGAALLGARVGQVVKFDAPIGERRLRVEAILYQPEAAGDFHL